MQEHPVDFVAGILRQRRDLEWKQCIPVDASTRIHLITDGDYAVAKYRYGRGHEYLCSYLEQAL